MPGRTPQVIIIGSTYVDMAIKCGQIPTAGQSIIGSALTYKATGPGPNQATEVALCLPMEGQVHLISKVGDDMFAEMARSSLKEFKVNTDFIFTAPAKNTGVIVTLVNAEGENAACYYPGANGALANRDIETAELIIADADVCLIHGGLPQEAIVSALRCAELYGTKVILNPARPMEQHSHKDSDLPIEYFSADILIPNLEEAADITEHSAVSIRTAKLIGSDLVARGVKHAIITMGRRGCMVIDRDGADHIPAFEVELVDQTGSGDAFAGALAAYCAVKDDIRGAAKFASAAGALACTKFGSIEAMPTRAEIIQLLQREDIDLMPGSQ
jgi:ribokinase